jgi:hypothetical protein
MKGNRIILLQEVNVTPSAYRLVEVFPTTDGYRSRLCDWRSTDILATEEEMVRRQNLIKG